MSLVAIAGSHLYRTSNTISPPQLWDLRGSFVASPGSFRNSTTGWTAPFPIAAADQHATLVTGIGLALSDAASDGEWDLFGASTDGTTFGTTLALYRSGGLWGLRVKRGATVIADTGVGVISASGGTLRYFIEWKVIHATGATGSTQIVVNEVVRASVSSVQTATGGTKWTAFGARSNAAFAATLDDIYVLTGAGSAPLNDLLGDIIVVLLGTTADASIQWTGGGATHWSRINSDWIPAAQVTDATEGHRDVYDTAAPTPARGSMTTGSSETYVAGKQVFAVFSGVNAACGEVPRKLKFGIRENSSDALGIAQLTTTFTDYWQVHPTAPDGSGWTTTKLDNLQLVLETGANT